MLCYVRVTSYRKDCREVRYGTMCNASSGFVLSCALGVCYIDLLADQNTAHRLLTYFDELLEELGDDSGSSNTFCDLVLGFF